MTVLLVASAWGAFTALLVVGMCRVAARADRDVV